MQIYKSKNYNYFMLIFPMRYEVLELNYFQSIKHHSTRCEDIFWQVFMALSCEYTVNSHKWMTMLAVFTDKPGDISSN